MTPDVKAALYDYLSGFATENKRRKIEQVLDHRTRYVTVVLEDIYQPQNASAVVRSCDCFGVQDLYVIENRNIFEVKAGVVLGASKWVDIHRFNHTNIDNTVACLTELKKRGYRLVATTPHRDDCMLEDLPLDGKMALLFGTEELGLSDTALSMADEYVRIPMFGFTESFNISVSVALCLYHIITALHKSDLPWRLTPVERLDIKLNWIRKVINRPDLLEKKFWEMRQLAGK
ncbi:MAG: RNA methyltransferase [candidate division KSB1 bacterium]|nr:RNA methyltransferase [candidate division KSB1 bacterium]